MADGLGALGQALLRCGLDDLARFRYDLARFRYDLARFLYARLYWLPRANAARCACSWFSSSTAAWYGAWRSSTSRANMSIVLYSSNGLKHSTCYWKSS